MFGDLSLVSFLKKTLGRLLLKWKNWKVKKGKLRIYWSLLLLKKKSTIFKFYVKYIFSTTCFTLKLWENQIHKSQTSYVPNLRMISLKNELSVRFCLCAVLNVYTRWNWLIMWPFWLWGVHMWLFFQDYVFFKSCPWFCLCVC